MCHGAGGLATTPTPTTLMRFPILVRFILRLRWPLLTLSGVTRRYDWTVTNTTMAPDGVSLQMLVVNDQL